MEDSILINIKKILGIDSTYDAFDLDIITHINTVFSDLQQLGVGPDNGFMIEDDTATWTEYFADNDVNWNAVKTYVYLRVRLLFDPPSTSYHITAIEKQIEKLEWRLNVRREGELWVDPNTLTP